MKGKCTNREKPQQQLRLFDQDQPHATLPPAQKAQLSARVEAMFAEIAQALAVGEAGDEQDHR
jgi:hypothetical protein